VQLRYSPAVFGSGHGKCMRQCTGAHLVKAIVAHLYIQYGLLVTDGRRVNREYMTLQDL
jgi:hypothetical protein